MNKCLQTVKPGVKKAVQKGPKTYFNDHLGLSVGIQKPRSLEFKKVSEPNKSSYNTLLKESVFATFY